MLALPKSEDSYGSRFALTKGFAWDVSLETLYGGQLELSGLLFVVFVVFFPNLKAYRLLWSQHTFKYCFFVSRSCTFAITTMYFYFLAFSLLFRAGSKLIWRCFLQFLLKLLIGVQSVWSSGKRIHRYKDNQKQEAIFESSSDRSSFAGANELTRSGWKILHR